MREIDINAISLPYMPTRGECTDANQAVKQGFYRTAQNTINLPEGAVGYLGHLLVLTSINFNNSHCIQIFFQRAMVPQRMFMRRISSVNSDENNSPWQEFLFVGQGCNCEEKTEPSEPEESEE